MTTSPVFIVVLVVVGYVVAAPFPTMTGLPAMGNFGAFQNMQQKQKQSQSNGTGAATGDASADFGQLQSQQTSNTLTNEKGTNAQSGSLGACSGGNCGLSGASQISAQGQQQKQSQLANQNLFGSQGILGNQQLGVGGAGGLLGGNLFANNLAQQKQKQSQSQIGGAAVGSGNAALGNISTAQNTQGLTDANGAQVISSSLGQGLGSQVALNGAVQATGQNQAAEQQSNKAGQDANQSVSRPECVNGKLVQTGTNALEHANQTQTQSQGDGAAVGQGSVGEGAVNSAQSSEVKTSDKGTLVGSNSAGQAAGKGGLKLSGATSASGQSASQKQSSLNAQGTQGQNLSC